MKKGKRSPYMTVNGKKDRINRHVMEEFLGRRLGKNEHVYHLNGDPYDNNLDNLVIITKNQTS